MMRFEVTEEWSPASFLLPLLSGISLLRLSVAILFCRFSLSTVKIFEFLPDSRPNLVAPSYQYRNIWQKITTISIIFSEELMMISIIALIIRLSFSK